jgi:transcriptional regulator with XRE-family HTH domain
LDSAVTDLPDDRALSRALGEEIRRAREAHGWTREELSARLPSGIGERTVLSYEHGIRHLSVIRLIEIGRAVGVDAATLLSRALQRARDHVETITLRVDLNRLQRDKTCAFQTMIPWVRNTLNEHPDGVAEVEPVVVRNLALFIGCTHRELADHLAGFAPE